MTRIIGHRGARGVELENSLASIRTALDLNVDGIEFDVHHTKDNKMVVIHDDNTKRVATQNVHINDVTLAELQEIQLKNGQQIPTLEQVLQLAGKRPIYIDVKDQGSAEELVRLLEKYPEAQVSFVSYSANELKKIRELRPEVPTYIYFLKAQNPIPHPIRWVRIAQSIQATGIGIDKLFINPITYRFAMRAGLKMYTYSIGTLTLARFLTLLYPKIDLCTSHPERLNAFFKKAS